MNPKSWSVFFSIVALAALALGPVAFAQSVPTFYRGDANDDGVVDISDVIHLAGFLFRGTAEVTCQVAADANDDDDLDISDMISLLHTLFVTGDPLPAPWPEVGTDPTVGLLTCDR